MKLQWWWSWCRWPGASGHVRLCWLAVFMVFAPLQTALADDVIILTSENFDEALSTHRVLLVEFYAPWCGHCQQLAPVYSQAATTLATEGVTLAKVDSTEEEQLSERFSIQAYPTLKIFRNGEIFDYQGPRTAAGIVEYMRDVASANWQPPLDPVLVLTQQNFSRVVMESEAVLVEFYAPWCGHCKKLAPEYQRAAGKLAELKIPGSLAKVDATEETELAALYSIKGYPTLLLFRKGNHKEYNGGRSANAIVEFMMEQAQPGSREISSYKELNVMRRELVDPLIVTFASSEDAPVLKAHMVAADEGRGRPVQFAHTVSSELAGKLRLEDGETAIFVPRWLRSKNEPEIKTYRLQERQEGGVLEELVAAARPLVGVRVQRNEGWFNSRPLLVLYCDVEEMSYVRDMVADIARDYSSQLIVAISNRDEYLEELEDLELGDWSEDVSVGLWGEGRERYAMTTPTSDTSIREFIKSYLAGELERVVKSQPKPKKAKDGAVTVVVGSTFQRLVMDPARDVLVEFYAPWCGHCKALEPVYQQLASKYKNDNSLLVAKFDATANDAPAKFEFSGFPALFFVPAGQDTQPVLYSQQERELENLVAFVEEHKTAVSPDRDEL